MKENKSTFNTCTKYIQNASTICDEPINKAYDQIKK
jgi:hypothetical protein